MDEITEQEAREKLKAAIPWKGSVKLAASLGISKGYWSEMVNGKAPLNDAILAFLGYRRAIVRDFQKDACYDAGVVANN